MEIILIKDVDNLGSKDDIVKVKNGYGLNHLIPKGFAIEATASAKKQLDVIIKQRSNKEQKLIEKANALADKIKDLKLKINVKISDSNKLFGSVTNSNIASALFKEGVKVDKKFIKITGGIIKSLGSYVATIRLHREVSANLNFEIAAQKNQSNKGKKSKNNKDKINIE